MQSILFKIWASSFKDAAELEALLTDRAIKYEAEIEGQRKAKKRPKANGKAATAAAKPNNSTGRSNVKLGQDTMLVIGHNQSVLPYLAPREKKAARILHNRLTASGPTRRLACQKVLIQAGMYRNNPAGMDSSYQIIRALVQKDVLEAQ